MRPKCETSRSGDQFDEPLYNINIKGDRFEMPIRSDTYQEDKNLL